MSNLREKARAVKAAGEAERGNFEPTGAPKRLYAYWLRNSDSSKAEAIRWGTRKENFCHFWRVVAIWAPLMWLSKKFSDNLDIIGVVLGLIVVAAFVTALILVNDFWLVVLGALGIIVGFTVGVFGLIAGISATLTPEERRRADLMRNRKTIIISGIIGFPTFIVGFLFAHLLGLVHRFVWQPAKNHPKPALAVFLVLLSQIGLWGAYAISGLSGMVVLTLIVLGAAAIVALGVFVAVVVSDYVSGKRELVRQQHELYYETHGEYPVVEKKQPSVVDRKIDAFFRGIGDFIILIAQVVRVNKWKICPIVEVKTDS